MLKNPFPPPQSSVSKGKFISIPRKPDGVPTPLSLAQRRLWFIYELDPTSPLYNMSRAWRLKGPVHIQALEASVNRILVRHEALRTTFQEIDGQPFQIIHPTLTVSLTQWDLSSHSPTTLDDEINRMIAKETTRPFDLRTGPLLRLTLIHRGPDDHVLVFTVHHIVFDGWSTMKFCKEISAYYGQTAKGHPVQLPPLPIQYADFSYWQEGQLTSDHLVSQLAYWKTQLQGAPLILEVPTDYPRQKGHTGRPGFLSFTIPSHVVIGLKQMSQKQGVTPFMTLLAAFQILLARYSGQQDILVGTPIANRTRTELEDLIGFFVNLLVLRTNLSGVQSFRDVLDQVRRVCLEAYRHAEIPFEHLVESLNPPRDQSRHPVVQVIFQLRQSSDVQLTLPDLSVDPLPVKRRTRNYDLHLICEEVDSHFKGLLYYPTDLFSDSTMARLATHYQTLLQGLIADPDQAVMQVPLMTQAERHQLLVEWNPSCSQIESALCVHDVFGAQVARTPDAVAIVTEDEQLTYASLNQRANQVAHYLRSLGVGPDVVVGLCLDRSLEMIIGLLGILKAGGAYLPLDPTLPRERVQYMIQEAHTSVLLTQQDLLGSLAASSTTRVCLDSDWSLIANESQANPVSQVCHNNLVYVLFTSGSTGQPKGIAVEHRQLVHYVDGILDRLDLPPGASFATVSPLAADLGNTMLYPSLCTGGTLHFISQERVVAPEALAEYFQRHSPDCLKVVPSHLEALLTGPTPKWVVPQKRLVIGGETCRWPLVEKVHALMPECVVINHYGPTEATVGVTTYRVSDTDQEQRGSAGVPIGRPLTNTQIYLLDAHYKPVPIGVPGELYIGGGGLARGYLTRPKLTAESYLPHPMSEQAGARVYKTGDWARYQANGTLEFLGRRDHQVKVRGFRIELGEIEAVLSAHCNAHVVVGVTDDAALGEKRLVAYIVEEAGTLPNLDEIKVALKSKLPDHMIPSKLVRLDALPLLPNGKIDRQALPEPELGRAELETLFVAPRSSLEEAVAEIWRDSLGLAQVGIHDNFFDLGGHSLLAIKILSRLKNTFSVDIPLRAILDSPTIAGVAATLASAGRGHERTEIAEIPSVQRNGFLTLSFTQERFWLLDQLNPNSTIYHSYRTFRLRGDLNTAALTQSLQEIVNRHEILRTVFPSPKGSPQQVIHPCLEIDVPIHDLQPVPPEDRERRVHDEIQKELQHPFDLTQGPLFRATLWKVEPHEHVLLLISAHIISDAWSKAVMLRELSFLYQAYCEGKPSPYSSLPLQYADFAAWQRAQVQGESGQRHLAYWKDHLKKPLPVLHLPSDFPRPAIQTHRGSRVTKLLPSSLSQQIRKMCQQEHCTVFMLLLSILSLLLSRYTGDEDIIIGVPTAGRNRQEWEGMIGCFLNTLALRIDLSGNPTFQELLRRVRQVTLDGQTHEDMPFEKLVEDLRVERDLSRSPLFQVFLNMHEFSDDELPLAGLEVFPFPRTHDRAHFDLTLYFKETEDGLRLSLNYNVELFSKLPMEELLNQLHGVLEETLASPELPIHAYSLVSSHGHTVLPDPSMSLATPPQPPIAQLIADWATQTPTHPVICYGNRSGTYRELMVQANTIACSLLAQGLQPGDVVAIFGPASFGLVACLLGVLKSGGVFLLIDPGLPAERQELMRDEAHATYHINIETTSGQTRLKENRLTRTHLTVDAETGNVQESRAKLHKEEAIDCPHVAPTDPAYIFFTSGTTGIPKAILGTHQGLSHFLTWQRERFDIGTQDRVAQLTGLSFDVILRDIFLPLTSGGVLCLPEDSDRVDGETILRWLDREQITVLHTVPTVAQYWLADAPPEVELSHLRWVFFSGEPLTDGLIQQWRKVFPHSGKQINLYGATETTLAKAFYQIPADPPAGVQPVGSPLPQTQLLVVTPGQQLCGIGELGEIVICTPFCTLGYLNGSQEQAQRFRPNPFTQEESDCWYWTGDMGRYRLDGSLEILGRIDDQIKIRGVRIEPDEITAILQGHHDLKAAVVLGYRGDETPNFLVAHVVPKSEAMPTEESIRTYLVSRVPSVMLPSAIVFLDALPVTPNGKVDRRALPPPELIPTNRSVLYVEPGTPIEKELAHILADLLKLERIGIHDNFFEVGGHSLLAIQVVNRVQKTFGVQFPLIQIFEGLSIAKWARYIESAKNESPLPSAQQSTIPSPDREEGLL